MAAFDYDVVIIGSGFGGSVAALRAAEKGYRVGVNVAAVSNRPHAVRCLLERGAGVGATHGRQGTTPLHLATRSTGASGTKGDACARLSGGAGRDQLRRARLLARRHGRAANGAGPALNRSSDDSCRHCSGVVVIPVSNSYNFTSPLRGMPRHFSRRTRHSRPIDPGKSSRDGRWEKDGCLPRGAPRCQPRPRRRRADASA
jgi:FAD binding domain